MCKGDKEIHGFTQNLVLLVLGHGGYGADVVKSVGKFDQYHTYIVIEGQDYSFEVFCLKGSSVIVHCRFDLGQTVYQ